MSRYGTICIRCKMLCAFQFDLPTLKQRFAGGVVRDRSADLVALVAKRGDGSDFGHAENPGPNRSEGLWRLRQNTALLGGDQTMVDRLEVVVGGVAVSGRGFARE